jgi:predicted alpha/beta hydrolase family esterase
MDNFDLKKYLAEGKLLKENIINNKYVVKDEDEDGDFYRIDLQKALDYLSQFNNEEVDAEQFINDDEGWGEFEQYLMNVEQMPDKELEDAMRQEMSFYYYSDGDSI